MGRPPKNQRGRRGKVASPDTKTRRGRPPQVLALLTKFTPVVVLVPCTKIDSGVPGCRGHERGADGPPGDGTR
jgi:hypothetical protein